MESYPDKLRRRCMKCKPKDCDGCVHHVNIRTHPLFKDFAIKDESGKLVDFEGCIFHLAIMFLRQLWVREIGIQSAIESRGDATKGAVEALMQLAMSSMEQRLLREG